MSLQVRTIRPSEYEPAKQVWDTCFPGDENGFSDHYFKKRTNPQNVLALFEEGVMKASLHILGQTARFFETQKDVAFIAGVATLPEYRHKGFANRLLKEAFTAAKRSGLSAAILQPFSHDFYRKTGFETFVSRNIYVFTRNDCERVKRPGLRTLCAERMLDIYNKFMLPYSGYRLRNKKDFELLLDEIDSTNGIALQSDNAYVLCDPVENEAVVTEFAGDEPEPLLASLFDCGFETVRFPMPEDRVIRGAYAVSEPFNMLRILDVKKFLIDLPAYNGEFIINVTDREVAGNCGRYRIEAAEQKIQTVEKVSDCIDGLTTDIARLMQRACGLTNALDDEPLNTVFPQKIVNYAFERY